MKAKFIITAEVTWDCDDEGQEPTAEYVRERIDTLIVEQVTGYHGAPDDWTTIKVEKV